MITTTTSQEDIIKLAPPCSCSSCKHGCTLGSGILVGKDKERIAEFLNMSGEELEKTHLEETKQFNKTYYRPKQIRKGKPYGTCTFFHPEKGCTIHPVKPLQCKISMGCKPYGDELMAWFVTNHLVDKEDKNSMREFESYKQSGGKTIPDGTC